MAVETEKILGSLITDGLVITKYGHRLPTKRIKILEAAHPVPDERSVKGVRETLQLLNKATEKDIVICLISGGASALWCDVPPGVSLQDVQITFDLLLKSGAGIHEMNAVRKHLSGIKGGQLVRHCGGARVFSLIISDVPGDDLDVIASGPTVADASSFKDAYAVLSKYNLTDLLPKGILQHLYEGLKGLLIETPKPGDQLFQRTNNKIIGTNQLALLAAKKMAEALGYNTVIIPGLVTEDAETAARDFVLTALMYKDKKPVCILQGGETTVHVTGGGKGGRNQHVALAALCEISKLQKENVARQITVLSGGTDGSDGPTDAAGAFIDFETLEAAMLKHLAPEAYLKHNDAYHFFQQTSSLLFTGPTQTNVMDIMIALVNNQ
jgi:glycerate-2-kinase